MKIQLFGILLLSMITSISLAAEEKEKLYRLELIFSMSQTIKDTQTAASYSHAWNYPTYGQNINTIFQAAQFTTNSARINFYRQKCQAIDQKYINTIDGKRKAIEEKIQLASALGTYLASIYDYDLAESGKATPVTVEDIYSAIRNHKDAGVCRHATVAINELLIACGFPPESIRMGAFYTEGRSAHIYTQVTTPYGTYSLNWSEIVKESTTAEANPQMNSKDIENNGLVIEWYDHNNQQIGTSYTDAGMIIREALDTNPKGVNESNLDQLGFIAQEKIVGLGISPKIFRGTRGTTKVEGIITTLFFQRQYDMFIEELPAETYFRSSLVFANAVNLQNGTETRKREYTAMDFQAFHRQSIVIAQHFKISALIGFNHFSAGQKATYLDPKLSGGYGVINNMPLVLDTTYEIPLNSKIKDPAMLSFKAGYGMDFSIYNMDSSASNRLNVYDQNGNRIDQSGKPRFELLLSQTHFFASAKFTGEQKSTLIEIKLDSTGDQRFQEYANYLTISLDQRISKTEKDEWRLKANASGTQQTSFYGADPVYYLSGSLGLSYQVGNLIFEGMFKLSTSSESILYQRPPELSFELSLKL